MEKNNAKIGHLALERYRKTLGDSLLLSLTFFLLFGSCFALAIIGVDISLLGILLIGLPALLSMQLMMLRPKKEEGLSNKQSFLGFRLYFGFYFGVYRFWLSLAKALLLFVLAALASSFALFHILYAVSPSFKEAVSSFSELAMQSETTIEMLYSALSSSTPLLNYCSWVMVIAFFFGGYWFFHEIGKNTLNTYVRSFLGAVPSRVANAIFSDFFRQERKPFYKDYFKANWLAPILFILGYAGGSSLGMLLLGSSSYGIAFGFLGACLLLSPYLPYFFYVMDEIAKKREKSLLSYALKEAEMALEQTPIGEMDQQGNRERLQKYIAELKRKIEEDQKETGDFFKENTSESEDDPFDEN